MAATLASLIEGYGSVQAICGEMNRTIEKIVYDSRQAAPGALFAAIKGLKADGHDYIEAAAEKGAHAIVANHSPLLERARCLDGDAPSHVIVPDTRNALAFISDRFYGSPSRKLTVTGITGTNGKTSTSLVLRAMLETAGRPSGVIGTVSYEFGGSSSPAGYTTPESVEYQDLLSRMLAAGCSDVVSEVSSHALAQSRVDFCRFGAAIFTNLTRDHLDYHGDMESYYLAKRRLFTEFLPVSGGGAAVNVDDPWGRRLAGECTAALITYGIENSDADLRASSIELGREGVSFTITYKGEALRLESPLLGLQNVYNLLAASAGALALGLTPAQVAEGARRAPDVPGRFERVDLGQNFLCLIDYAHTPDALARLIDTARGFTGGRIITVFGCGGDRDRGKRPLMAEAASEGSDLCIITSDNPRSEDPERIVRDMLSGIRGEGYRVMLDRREAIEFAVGEASPGDTVLIAGKGHETYMELNGVREHFSDREAAEAAIRKVVEE